MFGTFSGYIAAKLTARTGAAMFNEPEAAAYIRKNWSTEGIEVVGHDGDSSITVTLGVEVEDLSALLEDMRDRGFVADYRFCNSTKLGTVIFSRAADMATQLPGGGGGGPAPGSTSQIFFVCTTVILAAMSSVLAFNGPLWPALNDTSII